MAYDLYACAESLPSDDRFSLSMLEMSQAIEFLDLVDSLDDRLSPLDRHHPHHLTWRPSDPKGICSYKLHDNTGWVVSAQETQSTIDAVNEAIEDGRKLYPNDEPNAYTATEYLSENAHILNLIEWMNRVKTFEVY